MIIVLKLNYAVCSKTVRRHIVHADISWGIVWQRLSKDLTFAEIAERLNVSISTAQRIYQRLATFLGHIQEF